MLSVSDLSVSYGPVQAVREASLEVRAGEIVALLGANGAGKSSTMWALVGMAPRTGGRIVLDGRDVTGAAPEDVVRAGIAIVPEGRRVFANLTVRDNIRLGGVARRAGDPHGPLQRDEVGDLFPLLAERWDQVAGGLSGGQQQQLAIARALAARPRLVLLDEPSLGLSPRLVGEVFELMAELRRRAITLLVVEQNVQRSLAIADRAYVLQGGRIVLSGDAAEVRDSEATEAAFLGGRTTTRTTTTTTVTG
ncbi:ABC transporter ATP-binding protein [Conexibacter stalactiti]|uniref:ABC transporter ATP-binding protein n=1 Tax=Conexibacter stalactiti TaxID=1940611 RepID=UPI00384BB979